LQRLAMKLDHLQFHVKWIKGKDHEEADALSRAPFTIATPADEIDEYDDDITVDTAYIAVTLINEINADEYAKPELRDQRLVELREFANRDNEIQAVRDYVINGFPTKQSEMPDKLQVYWKHRADFNMDDDDFLCKGNQLVVPTELRQVYAGRLLAMHQGPDKMMDRAKMSVWWPYMKRDLQTADKTCKPCQENKPSNRPEPQINHEPATYPFQFIHMDLCQIEDRYFLITVDQYSGWPIIGECGKTMTTSQITEMVQILMRDYGCPTTIYSDGGPQFKENGEFDEFCKTWGIEHIKSSPNYPQSNGRAEVNVREMKKIIRATPTEPRTGKLRQPDLTQSLLAFRNTPRSPTGLSPAEILFGYPIRDGVPFSRNNFKKASKRRPEVEERMKQVREQVLPDRNERRGGRPLPTLREGQEVFIQHPTTKKWIESGTIISFGKNEREYLIRRSNGRTYIRNRHFLRVKEAEPTTPPRQPVQAPSTAPSTSTTTPFTTGPRRSESPSRETGKSSLKNPENVRPARERRLPVRFRDGTK